MLVAFIAAGFQPEAFWRLTPRMYRIHMRGAEGRAKADHANRAWLAWTTAYLPHAKKPPKFEKLAGIEERRKRPVSWQAQLAQWQAYAAARRN